MGLKKSELCFLTPISFLLTTQLCPQDFLFKAISSSAAHLQLLAQMCLSFLISPKSSCKNSAPFYLSLCFFPILKDQFSFSLWSSQRMTCKFRNQTLVVAEKICRNHSAAIPILQKGELTVAGIHLEPICSTNFPNHNSKISTETLEELEGCKL